MQLYRWFHAGRVKPLSDNPVKCRFFLRRFFQYHIGEPFCRNKGEVCFEIIRVHRHGLGVITVLVYSWNAGRNFFSLRKDSSFPSLLVTEPVEIAEPHGLVEKSQVSLKMSGAWVLPDSRLRRFTTTVSAVRVDAIAPDICPAFS